MINRLFRPADRSPLYVIYGLIGLGILIISLGLYPRAGWHIFATQGLMFVTGGLAEWLPVSQAKLSGALRLASMACALLILGLLVFMR
ncbi:MAG TPA: hypothetical protein VGE07_04990 [Herpetosiphonaceae bacterium]